MRVRCRTRCPTSNACPPPTRSAARSASSASAGRRSCSVTSSAGPAGFRELARAVDGVSDSVLSERLSDLAAGGLVTRTVDEGPPLSVSYALTDSGRALMPALEQIALWAQEHLRT